MMDTSALERKSQAPDREDGPGLVSQYSPLVKRIAHHLISRLPPSVQVGDLVQAGMIGLLEAARNYDATQGASFETYAGIRIRGAMLDEIRKGDWAPRSLHRRTRALAKAVHDIEAEHGRDARDAEVAERMGISLEEYFQILQDTSAHKVFSFEDVPSSGRGRLGRLHAENPGTSRIRGESRFPGGVGKGDRESPGTRTSGDRPLLRRRAQPAGGRRGIGRQRIAGMPDTFTGHDPAPGQNGGMDRKRLIGG